MDTSLVRPLLLLALSLPSVVLAAQSTTTAHASTTTAGSFPTSSSSGQDGTGVTAGGVGSLVNSGDPGADGAETGSISLSTGGIIGIAVAIAVVVIALVAMWSLWFIAKRRSWTIRETLKRASRRLTGRKGPPPTPRGGNRRQGTVYGVRDVERGADSTKPKQSEPVQSVKTAPSAGWLANEKERSRSRSPVSPIEPSESVPKPAKKFGFGFK